MKNLFKILFISFFCSNFSLGNIDSNPFIGWDYVYLVIKKDNEKVIIITLKLLSNNKQDKERDDALKREIRAEYEKKRNTAIIFAYCNFNGTPKSQIVPLSIASAESLNHSFQSFIKPEDINIRPKGPLQEPR
jgi:hypothetical protein